MKKIYEEISLQLIEIENMDVLTASGIDEVANGDGLTIGWKEL